MSFPWSLILIGLGSAILLPTAAAEEPRIELVDRCRTYECDPREANWARNDWDPYDVMLYASCQGNPAECPITTIEPPFLDRLPGEWSIGPTIVTDVPPLGGFDPNFRFSHNWFHWYHASATVEGSHGHHMSNIVAGIGSDLLFERENLWLYVYIRADQIQPASGLIDLMPNVGIYGRVETGREPFQGTLIAEGDTGAQVLPLTTLIAGQTHIVGVAPPSGFAYEFKVPLKLLTRAIPDSAEGLSVRFNVYQLRDSGASPGEGTQVTQSGWRLALDHRFPARLVLAAHEPLRTSEAQLACDVETVYATWGLSSPFGAYDVDLEGFRAHLTGPDGIDLDGVKFLGLRLRNTHEQFRPTEAGWSIPHRNLPDGNYTLSAAAMNRQRTVTLEHELHFTIDQGTPLVRRIIDGPVLKGRDTPAPDAVLLVASLGALAVAIGRRFQL